MKSYRSRGARLTAALTGVHKAPAERMDDDHKELLKQTRRIHTLEVRRRALKREVAAITKELRARRRGLKSFTIFMALRTTQVAREEILTRDMHYDTGDGPWCGEREPADGCTTDDSAAVTCLKCVARVLEENQVTRDEDRIEAGQARWAQTGSTRR